MNESKGEKPYMNCLYCGAEWTPEPGMAAERCPFCGAPLQKTEETAPLRELLQTMVWTHGPDALRSGAALKAALKEAGPEMALQRRILESFCSAEGPEQLLNLENADPLTQAAGREQAVQALAAGGHPARQFFWWLCEVCLGHPIPVPGEGAEEEISETVPETDGAAQAEPADPEPEDLPEESEDPSVESAPEMPAEEQTVPAPDSESGPDAGLLESSGLYMAPIQDF